MLLFGGRTAAGRVNDTWVLDLDTKAWAAPSLAGRPPSARSFHSAVALTSRAGAPLAAVFGGLDAACTHVRPPPHHNHSPPPPPPPHPAYPFPQHARPSARRTHPAPPRPAARSSTTSTCSTRAAGRG